MSFVTKPGLHCKIHRIAVVSVFLDHFLCLEAARMLFTVEMFEIESIFIHELLGRVAFNSMSSKEPKMIKKRVRIVDQIFKVYHENAKEAKA